MYEIENIQKEKALRKKYDDMLRYMQEIDNHKLKGPSERELVIFYEDNVIVVY